MAERVLSVSSTTHPLTSAQYSSSSMHALRRLATKPAVAQQWRRALRSQPVQHKMRPLCNASSSETSTTTTTTTATAGNNDTESQEPKPVSAQPPAATAAAEAAVATMSMAASALKNTTSNTINVDVDPQTPAAAAATTSTTSTTSAPAATVTEGTGDNVLAKEDAPAADISAAQKEIMSEKKGEEEKKGEVLETKREEIVEAVLVAESATVEAAAAAVGATTGETTTTAEAAATGETTRPAEAIPTVVESAAASVSQDPPPQQKQKQPKQKQQQKQQNNKGQKQQQGGGSKKGNSNNGGDVAKITPRSEDFGRWYLDVVRDAQLADYGPVRGTMVIRPYGYALWEGVQSWLDARFKETGHSNAYFPQLIPYSFLQKEAEHVEGFAPELALVTQGGGKELEEPLVVRPTSETIVNHMFAQWVQSYRDLPLLVNQWCNVHRWEMRTRPFIRTLEFLWQEGHTAHATWQEAEEETRQMIGIYEEFAREVAAVPVIAGRKSRLESFAGANCTYTIEAMMGDGRALQAGTSHNLGDNFARAFNTRFLDEDGELQYVYQSSWGVSTRMIGGIIMVHGDDAGLRLPPKLAPVQVVIVPILKKDADTVALRHAVDGLHDELKAAGIRVKVDDSPGKTPGWKFNHWELRGVPVRIEVGPRDVASGTCVVSRRDCPGKEGKQMGVPLSGEGLLTVVNETLEDIQMQLLREAIAFRDSNIVDVDSYEGLKEAIAAGKWARGPWAGDDEDELAIKEETGATLRCIPFEQPVMNQGSLGWSCFYSGKFTHEVAIFAKAY